LPGVDLSPLIPGGRQVVESYGEGRFRVTGTIWTGSVLVTRERTQAWPVTSVTEASAEELARLIDAAGRADVLLLGGGRRLMQPPPNFRAAMRARGIVVEAMDTGAAARTYNVLMAEDRLVAAALVAF
jgi:uncharacterized protein